MGNGRLGAQPAAPAARERNLGLDALRIFAMLLIVVIHIYNRGGVLSGLGEVSSLRYQLNFPLRALSMTAVNLYALISGYVMVQGRFRPARYFALWLQVVFIGLAACAIRAAVASEQMEWKNWLAAALPVTQYEYWYFTAYTGVFLLSPVLNRGLLTLTVRQRKALMAGVFGLFSVGWLLGKLFYGDSFHLGSGYSVLWLLAVYLFGACMRLSGFLQRTKAWKLWLVIALSLALMQVWHDVCSLQALPKEVQDWKQLSIAYCSPLIVSLSLCVFALFARLRVRGFAAKAVKWLSPLTFGVYLIHVHPAAWNLIDRLYKPLSALPDLLILPAVIAAAAGLYLSCSLLDWLRSLFFRLLRVQKLCEAAERRMLTLWN